MDLTLDILRARCAFWQQRLRLQDWTIELQIARRHEVGSGHFGDCLVHTNKRRAQIRIVRLEDHAGEQFACGDREAEEWELTLVHELLHVLLHDMCPKGLPSDTPEGIAEERAIDALTYALVRGEARP